MNKEVYLKELKAEYDREYKKWRETKERLEKEISKVFNELQEVDN